MGQQAAQGTSILLSAEQIARRVVELGRQISDDYRGKTLHLVCVLENSFMFAADLVRHIEVPVVCHFVRPELRQVEGRTEIFYTPEVQVGGCDVLLAEGLVQSGVTSEFLIRNFYARGANQVRLAVLLDKQAERRVHLRPDYYGFMVDASYVIGYGLGGPLLGRNLPYIATCIPPSLS